uniref:Cathepsin L n=1 Tax=Riptortus pedestris TaxID=329032 RepID=R4WCI3_RIPPE|nr:cathepsin L [Riptortus pedestris]
MKLLIIFGILAVVTASPLLEDWHGFKQYFSKTYNNLSEEKYRLGIYLKNKKIIEDHNQKFNEGRVSFSMQLNQFGDLTPEEFVESHLGCLKVPNDVKGATYISPAHLGDVPDNIDWREEGAVTPVKNQGFCGSCWAFSAGGALEAHNFRKNGKLIRVSEQNLVDCAVGHKYDCFGCNGGYMDGAFQYVIDNEGIDTEESYPYIGRDAKCRFKNNTIGGTASDIVKIPAGDEEKLAEAIATAGPVSIGIHATSAFQFYSKGVFSDSTCNPSALNHGVLAVGYGAEKGKDYWLVKNSWGRSWGDNGYIKMSRNAKNQCGVASMASYPLV